MFAPARAVWLREALRRKPCVLGHPHELSPHGCYGGAGAERSAPECPTKKNNGRMTRRLRSICGAGAPGIPPHLGRCERSERRWSPRTSTVLSSSIQTRRIAVLTPGELARPAGMVERRDSKDSVARLRTRAVSRPAPCSAVPCRSGIHVNVFPTMLPLALGMRRANP